jgi:hypothetical protein
VGYEPTYTQLNLIIGRQEVDGHIGQRQAGVVVQKVASAEKWRRERKTHSARKKEPGGKLNGRQYRPYTLPLRLHSSDDAQQMLMLSTTSAIDTAKLSVSRSTA